MIPSGSERDAQESVRGGVEQSTAVVFGAGNIGKGLLAELFQDAGLRTVFIETNPAVVESLRRVRSYALRLHSRRDVLARMIGSFDICRPDDCMAREALRRAEVCATAVGADNLQAVAPHIARACEERDRTTWNVLVCENRCDGAQILAEHVQAHLSGNRTRTPGIVQCSVERMVGRSAETESGEKERITTYRLGGESLTTVVRYMPESFCWGISKHPVETISDLKLFLNILRRGRIVPHLEQHRTLREQWGERGLLCLAVPRTPIPALIAEWCGVMATTFLSFDAPDLLGEVLLEMDRLADPVYHALVEYGPEVVHFADNISGENVGSFWDQHMAPVYRRRLQQLHDAGVICVIHNDGTVGGILDKIAQVGFDAAEAITPAPVGDVDPADLRALAGRDDFVLWGMVPGVMFHRDWSESRFIDYVRRVLDVCQGPMILGSADQVPPGSDLSRIRIVADILSEGRRP